MRTSLESRDDALGGGMLDIDRYDAGYREWLAGAIRKVRAEGTRSADTHLLMMRVPDAASVATIHVCEELLGRRVGASTGTGLWAAFRIADQMIRATQTGSIVTLLCDSGERYADKYYNPDWLKSQGLELEPYATQLRSFLGDEG